MSEPSSPVPAPRPGDTPHEHERQTMIRRIQQAMVEGHLDFEQIDDRFDAVYRAETRADLAAVVADLPAPVAPPPPEIAHPVALTGFNLFGDSKIGGWVDVDGDLSHGVLFGDIVIDLSSARLPPEVTVRTFSLFGDTVVIVPDGVRASADAVTLLGDRRVDLSPPRPGMPTVRVKAVGLLGDVKLYALSRVPEGKFRRLWRLLRGAP